MADNVRKTGSNNFGNASYWDSALASNQDLVIGSGADDLTVGTDQNAKDFLSVKFDSTYGSDATMIGTGSDGPLYFSVNQSGAGKFIFAGRCKQMQIKGGTIASATFSPRNASAAFFLTAGTWTEIHVENGIVDIAAACTLTDIYVYGGTLILRGDNADTPNIYVHGGRVILMRDYATLVISGGTVEHDLAAPEVATPATGGAITLAGKAAADATLVLKSGSAASLAARAGLVDKSQLRRNLTLTAATYHGGARIRSERNTFRVTESSTTTKGTGPVYV